MIDPTKEMTMPIKVVVLDLQGTLGTVGYEIPRSWWRSPVIKTQQQLLDEGWLQQSNFSGYSAVPDNFKEVPVINGETEQGTLDQLTALNRKGVVIYIATGDGQELEEGFQSVAVIREKGIPIAQDHVVNWDLLRQSGLPCEGDEEDINFNKKNPLLRYIMKKEDVRAEEVFFMDDGPGNVNAAKRLNIQTQQVNVPADLTAGLRYALDNAFEQNAAQSMPLQIDPVAAAASSAEISGAIPPIFTQDFSTLLPDMRSTFSVGTKAQRTIPSGEYWNTLTPEQRHTAYQNAILVDAQVTKTAARIPDTAERGEVPGNDVDPQKTGCSVM